MHKTQFKNAIKKIVMSMKINNHLRPVSPSARDTYGSINGSIYLKMEKGKSIKYDTWI